jgi:hypothetical protein
MSFIIWAVGAQLLALSIFCAGTAPSLYNFTLYLVVTYWLGFFIIGCYLIKLKYGNFIEQYISSQAKGPSVEDMEERIFRKEFKKFDKKKLGTLPQELLSDFLVKVAVFVPEEELPSILTELGVVGSEEIEFNKLLAWFKEYNVKMNGYGDVDGGDEDEDEDEASKKKSGGGVKGFFNRSTSKAEPTPNAEAVKKSDSLPAEESSAASSSVLKRGQSEGVGLAVKELEEEEED